jgi:hypothetical protein
MEKLGERIQTGDWKQEKHVAAIECPAEILMTNQQPGWVSPLDISMVLWPSLKCHKFVIFLTTVL